jgi:hypothetical protein
MILTSHKLVYWYKENKRGGGAGVEEIFPKLKLVDIMETRDCLLQWATEAKTPLFFH